jgi:hypothetical protein
MNAEKMKERERRLPIGFSDLGQEAAVEVRNVHL